MLRKSFTAALAAAVLAFTANFAAAADAQLERDAKAALQELYAKVPEAKALEAKSKGILVFPSVTKAGVGIGGQYGKGVGYMNGKVIGYFSTSAASVGLQLGVQRFGYAMFLLTDKAVADIKTANGFEIGFGPSIVFVDEGMAKNITTATVQPDVYAFVFSQKGLMAGAGLQGSKISRIDM